ncbi:hypothetical protein CIRG_02114 [Coccidioides immitis RMSCC 2394]|uniref:Uncharacterized protein n=1 Tax=Coccidioides immitis RMSCC 2394 TaxID=404692 RepID=A0A0J6Y2N5_COCIT|nr:hypothetical protein CIRG_02114 [Coccidioides immitis RMSCC 2394]
MRERFAFTIRDEGEKRGRPDHDPDGLVLEAWAQGFMVGTLVFMAAITIANMRRRMLLHKLILAEDPPLGASFPYDFGISELLRNGPRFGIMLIAMCISIIFIIFDTLSVLRVLKGALPTGINPFWKLSFVFKCLCDAVVLDDFKTALDRLRDYWLAKNGVEVEGTERQSKSNAAATPVNRSRFWRNSAGIIEPLELKRQQKDDTNCSSSGLSQENQVTPFGHL